MATKKTAGKKKAVAAKKPAAKPAAAKKLTTKDTIKANNKAIGAKVAAGDAAGIAALYTKKAILMPPGMPMQKGGKNIRGFWAGAVQMGVKGATLKTTEVDELGTTAIECGNYVLKGENGVELDAGKYVVVWKKEGGAWKLHRDIFNTDKAAPAA